MFLSDLDRTLTDLVTSAGWPWDAMIRLGLAAVCGGIIGIEREMRGRQAGFRTNLLVCVGSAIVMIVSTRVGVHAWPSPGAANVQISSDPGRIAYGVMTGIGFIGAGTIIHNKGSIRGLTTAAAMWCVAAIGLGAGFGLYLFTILASLLVVVVLWILQYVDHLIPQTHYRTLTFQVPWSADCTARVVGYLKGHGFHVVDSAFDRRDDPAKAIVTTNVAYRSEDHYLELERTMAGNSDFELLATRETQQ